MSREDRIEKLKVRIGEYLANGGSIQDAKKDIPYYNFMTDIIKYDKKNGKNTTIASLYKECGYEYISKGGKEVSISRLKEEIDAFVSAGGNIYDKKQNIPYYQLMLNLIKKDESLSIKKLYELCEYEYEEKNMPISISRIKKEIDTFVKAGGNIQDSKDNVPYYGLIMDFIRANKKHGVSYNIEDIYKMCGYEYETRINATYKLNKILEECKDYKGYVDCLKNTKQGKLVIDRIRSRARNLGVDFNTYLMIMHGVRMSGTFSEIDYIEYVGEEIGKFVEEHGIESLTLKNLHDNYKNLYSKINHVGLYFPQGSISNGEVLDFYGYSSSETLRKKVNEKKLLKVLREVYPTGEVSNITFNSSLFYNVVRISVENGISVEEYLNSRGFKVTIGMKMDRLAKAKLEENNEIYRRICSIRKKLILDSKVDFDGDDITSINNELERIGKETYKIYNAQRRI